MNLSELPYYNEACANCGTPACLHTEPPHESGVNGWPKPCGGSQSFKMCNPRKAAYGSLGGPC